MQTKAATEHELVFKSASNSSFNSREASVVLRQKNGDINTVINVVQTGEEAILINADYGYDYLYFDGLYYTITSTDDCTASVSSWGKESSEEVRIPSYISYKGKQLKVNNIGHAAFKGMDYLHKLIVPWTISSITQEAFVVCTGLKDIIFEDSDEELELSFQKYESNPGYFGAGKGLFYDCPLETIELGRNILYNDYEDSAAKYGYSPFYNKTSLVSFICSDHVTRIGNYLLSGSTSLTNLVFSSKIQEIGIHAFAGSGIIEVQLPESLNQIGANAFNSSLIEKIVLPKSLKELPSGSFNNCYRLKEIHIYGLEKILSQAFSGCSKIRNIYCYVNNPPTFVLQSAGVIVSFDTSVFTEGTLYVPSDCVESYQSSEEWKKFWSIKPLP